MNDYGRFFLRFSCFLFSAYAALFIAGQVLERGVDWRAVQDPRKRLLWDSNYDGSRIVILGDSEFLSFGVDTPDKMLGSQLASLTGEKVFSGALDGAKGPDILMAARFVADQWPKGTIVFVDIIPSRFFFAESAANYKYSFDYIVKAQSENCDDKVKNLLIFPVTHRLFIFRNSEAVNSYFLHLIYRLSGRPETPFFHNDTSYNRVWDRDGDFALKRYQVFEDNFEKGRSTFSFGFIKELMSVGQGKEIKIVFVLTPLNVDLIKKYANHVAPQAVIQRFDNAHAELVDFLKREDCPYIDLYSSIPSEGFADLIHTNEKGDGILAGQMARWFAEHSQ